jgi:hypothetical protein
MFWSLHLSRQFAPNFLWVVPWGRWRVWALGLAGKLDGVPYSVTGAHGQSAGSAYCAETLTIWMGPISTGSSLGLPAGRSTPRVGRFTPNTQSPRMAWRERHQF